MVRFNLECISEHPISQSGQCGGRWTEKVWRRRGEKKKKQGSKQQMVMDGDQVHFLCKRWADAVLELVQSAGSEGKCGALSPVCPGGPHVCDDRTPAASPKPSSQTPGSYCFSPFGCPARGWNTDRYLHWRHGNHGISFTLCRSDFCASKPLKTLSILHKTVFFFFYYLEIMYSVQRFDSLG